MDPFTEGLRLSSEQTTEARDIVSQISALSERNSGLDLIVVSEEDRNQVVLLSARLYRLARLSRFSAEDFASSVRFIDDINPESQKVRGSVEHNPASYNPQTGQISVWMRAEMLRRETYEVNPALGRYHSPISALVQFLTHEFHHKEAQNPASEETGFSTIHTFNEIVTEYLRSEADKRAGLIIVSGYPIITARLPVLQRLLAMHGITEQKLIELYNNRDLLGLARLLAAKEFPNEYRRFISKPKSLADENDKAGVMLVRHGIGLIRNIESGV